MQPETVCGISGQRTRWQTELTEIDENVVRTELSVIEYSELLERRKEIYESLPRRRKLVRLRQRG